MSDLNGKVAIVTGASKGIGAGIARTLGAAGASVVVNYASSKDGADKVVAEIVAGGGRAIAVQGDVAKAADVKRLFAEAKTAFGTLDILVNNAGVYGFAALEEVTEAEYDRQFGTNVRGLILATQEALNHFGNHGGSVINIGSVASAQTVPGAVVYSATKAAVDAVTRVLAAELGPRGIRVNTLAPGAIETEGARDLGVMDSDFGKQIVADTPLGRFGQPDDIGKVALFLASDQSGWITGERLVASGGY